MYLTQPQPDFNATEPDKPVAKHGGAMLRREFGRLGVELHHRGSRPVAEFVSELADLALDVAAEVQARLEVYTRIPTEVYQALEADSYSPYMIAIDGGRE